MLTYSGWSTRPTAILAGLILVLLLASCDEGSSKAKGDQPARENTTAGPVLTTIEAATPSGWTAGDLTAPKKGRIYALDPAELTRERPQGPRARIEIVDASSAVALADALSRAQPPSGPNKVEVVAEPRARADKAVEVTTRQTYGTQTYFVSYAIFKVQESTSILVTIDAPSGVINPHVATLDELVRTMKWK